MDTACDYVAKLEQLRDWNDLTLSRRRCEVAREALNNERQAQQISLDDWYALRERISQVEQWLIEHDRW